MAIPKFNDDMDIIGRLGDRPGTEDGLTTEEFKQLFDLAGKRIKEYLNETLIPELNLIIDADEITQSILDQTLSNNGGDLNGDLNMNGAINMNENPITGLETPTKGDHAANKDYVDGATAVNYLGNSNFKKPVNQKYNTDKYAEHYTYDGVVVQKEMVDRWQNAQQPTIMNSRALTCVCDGFVRVVNKTVGGGEFTTPDGGLVSLLAFNMVPVETTFTQYLEDTLPNGNYTFAMKMRNDMPVKLMINDTAVEFNASEDWTVNVVTVKDSEVSRVSFVIPAECVADFEWAALYDGKYTAETLPEYSAKDFAEELSKCYRHYFSPNKGKTVLQGVAANTKTLYAVIYTPVEMRVKPSLVGIPVITALRGGGVYFTSDDVNIENISVNMQSSNLIRLSIELIEEKAVTRKMFQINLEGFALSAEMG